MLIHLLPALIIVSACSFDSVAATKSSSKRSSLAATNGGQFDRFRIGLAGAAHNHRRATAAVANRHGTAGHTIRNAIVVARDAILSLNPTAAVVPGQDIATNALIAQAVLNSVNAPSSNATTNGSIVAVINASNGTKVTITLVTGSDSIPTSAAAAIRDASVSRIVQPLTTIVSAASPSIANVLTTSSSAATPTAVIAALTTLSPSADVKSVVATSTDAIVISNSMNTLTTLITAKDPEPTSAVTSHSTSKATAVDVTEGASASSSTSRAIATGNISASIQSSGTFVVVPTTIPSVGTPATTTAATATTTSLTSSLSSSTDALSSLTSIVLPVITSPTSPLVLPTTTPTATPTFTNPAAPASTSRPNDSSLPVVVVAANSTTLVVEVGPVTIGPSTTAPVTVLSTTATSVTTPVISLSPTATSSATITVGSVVTETGTGTRSIPTSASGTVNSTIALPTSIIAVSSINSTPPTPTTAPADGNNTLNAWLATSLVIISQTAPSSGISSTALAAFAGASTTIVNGIPSVTITSAIGFPTDLPTKIVPATTSSSSSTDENGTVNIGGAAAAAPIVASASDGTTQISILFGPELAWLWMTQNSQASAQLFTYTPLAIAAALNISPSLVRTVSLAAYQPSGYDGNAATILTVYLAVIPTVDVDALQAQIKAPNSPLYQQTGVQGQIAKLMNPAFSILAYSSTDQTSGGSGGTSLSSNALDSTNLNGATTSSTAGDAGGLSQRSKTIIIAVVVTFGIVILGIAAYAALWSTKRGAVALPSSRIYERSANGNGDLNGNGHRRQPSGLRSFQLGGGNGYMGGSGGGVAGNALTRTDSISTISSASTDSTGYSGSSRVSIGDFTTVPSTNGHSGSGSGSHGTSSGGGGGGGRGAGARRSSWWRFSAGSNHGHQQSPQSHSTDHSASPPMTPFEQHYAQQLAQQQYQPEMREHRRINVVRSANGHFDAIGQPQIQSNSLML